MIQGEVLIIFKSSVNPSIECYMTMFIQTTKAYQTSLPSRQAPSNLSKYSPVLTASTLPTTKLLPSHHHTHPTHAHFRIPITHVLSTFAFTPYNETDYEREYDSHQSCVYVAEAEVEISICTREFSRDCRKPVRFFEVCSSETKGC